jgi:hypothetical protein
LGVDLEEYIVAIRRHDQIDRSKPQPEVAAQRDAPCALCFWQGETTGSLHDCA